MKIHVHHDGEKLGPLSVEEVRALLADGKISPETDAWVEGTEDWVPLADISVLKPAVAEAKAAEGGHTVEPMASVKGDFKQLKANSAATAGELREFMAEMRGQTPREMLGTIAQSSLVRSVTLSAVCVCALLLALSGIAYGVRDAAPEKPAEKDAAEQPANQPPTKGTNAAAAPVAGTNDVLRINQTKNGKPKETNPFDTKGDLLDEIK